MRVNGIKKLNLLLKEKYSSPEEEIKKNVLNTMNFSQKKNGNLIIYPISIFLFLQ